MIAVRIKALREAAGYSQAQLAKRIGVTRSALNAWEMGLSAPTTRYIVDMAKIFHVSSDYILGLSTENVIVLDGYSSDEITLIQNMLKYFDDRKTE